MPVAAALAVGMLGHTGGYRCQPAPAATAHTKGVGSRSPVAPQAGGFPNRGKGSFCWAAYTCCCVKQRWLPVLVVGGLTVILPFTLQ